VHETLARVLDVDPLGTGVGSMVQAAPFQPSANVALPRAVPTAVHDAAVAHDTPEKSAKSH
jgi:hypothetical protein